MNFVLKKGQICAHNYKVIGRMFGSEGEEHMYDNIFEAVHIESSERYVIKQVDSEQYFFNEKSALEQLSHTGIIKLADVCHTGCNDNLILEYLPNAFADFFRGHTKKDAKLVARVHDMMQQLTQIVDYQASQGVVHRDINPNNIRVRGDELVLFDYDLSHHEHTVLATTPIIATGEYFVPERAAGVVTPQYDVYLTGMVGLKTLANHQRMTNKKSYRQLSNFHFDSADISNPSIRAPMESGKYQAELLAQIDGVYGKELTEAIRQMVIVDPADRPNPTEAAAFFS